MGAFGHDLRAAGPADSQGGQSALLGSLANRLLDDTFFAPTSLEDSRAARRALPLTCCGAAVGAAAVADEWIADMLERSRWMDAYVALGWALC